MDVRLDPIGPVNRFIIWTFTGKKPRVLRMTHPYGIIISGDVVLGNNVTVFQGGTIDSKRDGKAAGSPIIEDNVCIFPNAVLIGRIRISLGAIVAPGSVVINDVPAGTTVAGNPAKVINRADNSETLVL